MRIAHPAEHVGNASSMDEAAGTAATADLAAAADLPLLDLLLNELAGLSILGYSTSTVDPY
jgi:hypothetical protein